MVFTVATRIEEDNSTRTEVHLVPSDASSRAAPHPPLRQGRQRARRGPTTAACGTPPIGSSGRSIRQTRPPCPLKADEPAGRRRARAPTRNGSRSRRTSRSRRKTPTYASDFEQRHEERFKGVTFDWKDFQRDGQPFPAPNLRARPAAQLVDPAGRRRRRQGARRRRSASDQPRVAPERHAARLHRRSRLARRAEVREPGPVDGDDRRARSRGSPTTATSTATSGSRPTARFMSYVAQRSAPT